MASVEVRRVVLSFGGQPAKETLRPLFEASFMSRPPHQLIDLPGTQSPPRPSKASVLAELQRAIRTTFLQHNKTVTVAGVDLPPAPRKTKGMSDEEQVALKAAKKLATQVKKAARTAARKTLTFEVDDRQVTIEVEGYSSFAHRDAWEEIASKLERSGSVELAGWAYPGGAQRHIDFNATKLAYSPGQAIAACFALVGCVSLLLPELEVQEAGKTKFVPRGCIVVPKPADLVAFAAARPLMTPSSLEDAHVASAGDAVLRARLLLRMASVARASVAGIQAVVMGKVPWDKQQKVRTATLASGDIPERVLDAYETVASRLPTKAKVWVRAGDVGADSVEKVGYFIKPSALRGFVTDNLARGRPWFEGFATARTEDSKPRFIHYFRDKDRKNLGALFASEKQGLVTLVKEHLMGPEERLVTSIHVAIRQRFGAIANECKDNPVAMKNRFKGEREKWRLAFAGAKTHEQVRGALADLWSKAGSNSELREGWRELLPLLGEALWRTARDLALVALASYQAKGIEEEDIEDAATAGEEV